MEQAVVRLREKHPWGGRKIHRRLQVLGYPDVPAPSTITGILRRHARLAPSSSCASFTRFERKVANELWQMDFKGHFALGNAQRCHPLTVLDDHSRFSLCLKACANERTDTVQQALTRTLRRYGLPQQLIVDNGAPWGSDQTHYLTPLTVWMMRLGIRVAHSRPYHPQTLGKEERFHRTLKAEVLAVRVFRDLDHTQHHFDRWRIHYKYDSYYPTSLCG